MRDQKDNATLDLPGFAPAAPPAARAEARRATGPRPQQRLPVQEQLELLEASDASGLPLWHRDDTLDLSGLPVWSAA